MGEATVKTHLHRLFAKTETTRQPSWSSWPPASPVRWSTDRHAACGNSTGSHLLDRPTTPRKSIDGRGAYKPRAKSPHRRWNGPPDETGKKETEHDYACNDCDPRALRPGARPGHRRIELHRGHEPSRTGNGSFHFVDLGRLCVYCCRRLDRLAVRLVGETGAAPVRQSCRRRTATADVRLLEFGKSFLFDLCAWNSRPQPAIALRSGASP